MKILFRQKLCTDISFNLRQTRARYLVLQRSFVNSPEGQKLPINQLKLEFTKANRAEIFTRVISPKDQQFLKISAQKTNPEWEIISRGGGLKTTQNKTIWLVDLMGSHRKHHWIWLDFVGFCQKSSDPCHRNPIGFCRTWQVPMGSVSECSPWEPFFS